MTKGVALTASGETLIPPLRAFMLAECLYPIDPTDAFSITFSSVLNFLHEKKAHLFPFIF